MSTLLVACRNKTLAARHYVPALHAAGWRGKIQLVAPGDPSPALEGVSGLLLTGGGDIDPKAWDPAEPVHPKAEVDAERDAFEIPLIKAAWDKSLPILVICRGQQILNVALGGSMVQDIPDHFGCESERHNHGTHEVPEVRHTVNITHDSRLYHLVGGAKAYVNSRHHQCVKKIAPGLKAVAFHPETLKDGQPLVEGVEATDPQRWVVGVQWHPENLVEMEHAAGVAARGLFFGFVKAMGMEDSE